MAVRYTCQRLIKNFQNLVGVSLLSEGNLPKPEILLERGAVLVLNKPGGLLTQAPPGVDW